MATNGWIDLPAVTVLQGTTPWVVTGVITTSPDVNIHDSAGNNLTSTNNGGKLSLDVNVSNTTPIPVIGTITTSPDVNIHDSAGNSLTSTTGFLDTFVQNFPSTFGVTQSTTPWIVDGSGFVQPVSGTVTALQGTSPWVVSGTITTSPDVNIHDSAGLSLGSTAGALNTFITNATLAVTQSGVWSVGRTWDLNFATDQVDITGSSVTALQGTSPWVISGTVAATQSGAWTTGRTWDLSFAADQVDATGSSVSVSNFPATQSVTQGTSPWVVSGTVTANQGTSPWVVSGTVVSGDDHNYGVVGATTLRTAAQIGNATGAANFNAGTTSAQTLRVVLPTDQTSIPVTQSGTWTVQPGNTANTTPWLVTSKADLAPASPTSASVGVASAQAVASNASRKGLCLVNTSLAKISLGFGATAVLNSGITLFPGDSFTMDEFTFDTGAVNAIAGAAASNLSIQEYS